MFFYSPISVDQFLFKFFRVCYAAKHRRRIKIHRLPEDSDRSAGICFKTIPTAITIYLRLDNL